MELLQVWRSFSRYPGPASLHYGQCWSPACHCPLVTCLFGCLPWGFHWATGELWNGSACCPPFTFVCVGGGGGAKIAGCLKGSLFVCIYKQESCSSMGLLLPSIDTGLALVMLGFGTVKCLQQPPAMTGTPQVLPGSAGGNPPGDPDGVHPGIPGSGIPTHQLLLQEGGYKRRGFHTMVYSYIHFLPIVCSNLYFSLFPFPPIPSLLLSSALNTSLHTLSLQPIPSPVPPTPPATSGIGSPATQPAMTPEENEAYLRKLGELQKYIPLMSKWISRLSKDDRKDDRKSDQFLKLKSLHNLLQDNNKRSSPVIWWSLL